MKLDQFFLRHILCWPSDDETFLISSGRFGNDMEMDMVYHLMCYTSVVLQNIVIFEALGEGNLLRNGHNISKVLVRKLMQFLSVIFRNNKGVSFRKRPNVEEGETDYRIKTSLRQQYNAHR